MWKNTSLDCMYDYTYTKKVLRKFIAFKCWIGPTTEVFEFPKAYFLLL